MSTTRQAADNSVHEPSDERIRRLAVEAGKYLGRESGDTLPAEEVRLQAEANGYDSDQLLPPGTRELRIPEQGDLLGDLWRNDPSPTLDPFDLPDEYLIGTRAPNPTTHTFRRWLDGRCEKRRREYDDGTYQHPVEHAYSYKAESAKFARAKDVGRHFVKEHPRFTTVLITYTRPLESGETIAEHAASFYPRKIRACRRRCIKRANAFNGYAGVSLLAPKEGTDVAPTPITHTHDFLWLPGYALSEAFDPLRRRDGVHVSIRYHRSEKVSTPSSVNRYDLDRERGPTTALAQEVGANLPVFAAIETFREEVDSDSCDNPAARKATLDASDCPEYVERWCAEMRLGEDGDIETKGVPRWRELGRFTEIADNPQERRNGDVCAEGVGAQALTETEHQFVDEYVQEVGDYSAKRICTFLEANRSEFDAEPDPQAIVPVIRERL